MEFTKRIGLAMALVLLFAGCSPVMEEFTYEKTEKNIDHVHGLGFSDNNLYIATHTGIMKYDGQSWYETTGNKHDYMGFSLTKEGFYSSGHPGEGSKLKNPLGLMKSTDEGKTLEQLAFYGESDFHYLTAGFDTKVIYVINQEPNSELKPGMYYTVDEGETWESSKFSGVKSDSIGNISAHPKKEELVAVSTKEGLYLSKDHGNNFRLITEPFMVPAVFMLEDEVIYSAINNKGIHLHRQNIKDGSTTEVPIPDLTEDNPVIFIAANYDNPDQMAVVTYTSDIFTTEDRGVNWIKIAEKGKVLNK